MAYEIRAHRDGYRRGGMAHSTTARVHPASAFTQAQLEQLQADPRIMIVAVAEPKAVAKHKADDQGEGDKPK